MCRLFVVGPTWNPDGWAQRGPFKSSASPLPAGCEHCRSLDDNEQVPLNSGTRLWQRRFHTAALCCWWISGGFWNANAQLQNDWLKQCMSDDGLTC